MTHLTTRRPRAVRLAAMAVAASLTLAACTDDAGPGPEDGAVPDNTGTPDAAMESPMLTELVDAGDLPPLEERLPATPMVLEPVHSEGSFGGTLRRAQTDGQARAVLESFANVGLMEWNWENDTPAPSLAESVEVSEDNTTYTFTLREGLKWSDGEPFTTEDLMFTIDDYLNNATTMPFPPFWFSDGDGTPDAEATDELTLTITFDEPFALFQKYMAHPAVSHQFIKPKHYLEQFHPDYTDPAEVDAAVQEAGFDSWDQLFADRDNSWTNPERAVMGAWLVVNPASSSSATAELERNPYYWKTDPSGRQLPYIDEIQVQVLAQDALDLRAANGDLDFQANHLGYNTTQVYLENAEQRGYNVLRWAPTGSLLGMNFNLSHKDEDMRELFLEDDFRAAFSQAIDREDMNERLLGGLGVITQPTSPEGSDYYVEGAGQNNIEHDPDEANRLLDGLGLTETESDGTRLMADGTPLEIVLSYVEDNAMVPRTDAYNMVRANLAEVGIDLILRPVDGSLYGELRGGNDFDMSGTTVAEDDWDLEPVWYIPTAPNSHSAPGYGQWYVSGGAEGMEPPAEIQELMDSWDALRGAESDEDRIAAGQEIMRQHDENTYIVGLLKLPFQPVIAADNLVNVRDDQPKFSFYYGREGVTKPELLFYAGE
ncbi:ABC transporter substrate-binding protein [Georgenia sp. MJ173]|uniref:ABC transporter substrate-binding protein n=1 Tax=Georgenia sunbinii TaxID=3117728 RepID=UPI002F269293